jgi:SAM-dependent methyltransferase
MSRSKSLLRNFRTLFADDFIERWRANDARLDERTGLLDERMTALENRLEERASNYERAIDTRLDERFSALDARLDDYQKSIDMRLEERFSAIDGRLDSHQSALDKRIDERLEATEKAIDQKFDSLERQSQTRADQFEGALTARTTEFEAGVSARATKFEEALTTRANTFETAIDKRLMGFEQEALKRSDEYEAALDARLDARFVAAETRLDAQMQTAEERIDQTLAETRQRIDARFDERVTSADVRLDERFVRIERYIDTRFNSLEERADSRMEAHERLVDGKLHQRSQDIVDRNDLMLQIFDQRLDKMRRDLHTLPGSEVKAARNFSGNAGESGQNGEHGSSTETSEQLVSFRRLAESGAAQLSRVGAGPMPIYQQILAWKKIAHEGIRDYTPDEQEMADYILSFLNDPREEAYSKHHMRRFIATLQRIPPPQSPDDRLLELGSLLHLAPAIKKYCGYQHVFGADSWPGEQVEYETVSRYDGEESHTFELRNFNVEADPFPYEDGFFRTVLCCELIEHLRRDPMHMLWECNRVLQPGGYLLLTTPNIASARAIEGLLAGCGPYHFAQYNRTDIADQHNREYAPYEVGVALAAAGFTVVALETEDVWLRSNPAIIELLRELQIWTELRADNIFALAQKTSAPIERFPQELYVD